MVTQINPFQQQVWRSINELQIGLSANKVRLVNLTQPQERFVASLFSGIADNQIESLAKQLKLDLVDARRIADELKPVLLADIMNQPTPADFQNGDLVRVTLDTQENGYKLLENRSTKSVYLNSLGRAGASLTLALAAAGIGRIASDDEGRVGLADVPGYLKSLENCRRLEAIDFQIRQFGFNSEVAKAAFDRCSVAVFIAQQHLTPISYAPLMNREIPHVSIVFDSMGVTVSPLVLPGETPCLFCNEQQKIDEDAGWPLIVSQLTSSDQRFDDTASVSFATGWVTKLITDRIDLGTSTQIGVRWFSQTGKLETFEIRPNENCACLLALRIKQIEESRALAS